MDMNNAPSQINYEDRLNRVTAYIYDHLDDDIDLNRLADVACLSPYHWHRVYRAVTGETIAATVKRLRLHRAAGYLAHTSMPVAEIAVRSGYTNLQSFTRIFSAAYGCRPANTGRTAATCASSRRTKRTSRICMRSRSGNCRI